MGRGVAVHANIYVCVFVCVRAQDLLFTRKAEITI